MFINIIHLEFTLSTVMELSTQEMFGRDMKFIIYLITSMIFINTFI